MATSSSFPSISEHTRGRIEELQKARVGDNKVVVGELCGFDCLLAQVIRYPGTAPQSVQRFFMQVIQPVFIGASASALPFLSVTWDWPGQY
jgi:hypothetical protein